jgi:hypothetical protein
VNAAAAALLLLATTAATPPAAPPNVHRIPIEVRGPLALIEVTRTLPADGPASFDRLLDVALPQNAALVDVAVSDAGKWRAVEAAGDASKRYLAALEARRLAPSREPYDDDTTYRVRVAAAPAAPLTVRYRFSLLPPTAEGRRRIRFPASPDRLPSPADVTFSVDHAADVELAGVRTAFGGRGAGTARGRVSTRGAWEISWAQRPAGAPAGTRALDGSLAFAKVSPSETLVAVDVEAVSGREREPPPHVLLLIDRSRSVGLPGLAAERDLARRLLEALPPATRFDALFFDRDTRRLFPASRTATREAIAALEAEMVPDRMRNGTDLAGALREAGTLLRREASAFTPRVLLALVTDGALPEGPDAAALTDALGAVPGVDLTLAAWVIRPEGDEAAPARARVTLRRLAALRGGLLRELTPRQLNETMPAALAALAHGGDAADVRLVLGGTGHALAEHLAPGEARADLLKVAALGRGAPELAGTARGGRVHATVRPRAVEPTWLRAFARGGAETRLLETPDLVAFVEAPRRDAPESAVVRGELDRTVVRNTLSLAYSPRARACYLNRGAATPALRDLAGRVRLAIDLARGEVGKVIVESSTLGAPAIEACLRDGAFEIDVPRALRSDAPVTAVLNLVFRPRTPEKRTSADEAALGAQIDLVIEELHREEAAASSETPAPDRSMIPTR